MLAIYLRTLLVCWQTYGPRPPFWAWLIGEPLMKLFTFATLALDHLFFPGFRHCQVKKPIFIIGHPRSGTTFLHQLLNQPGETAAFPAWHLLFPALSARFLLRPLIQKAIAKGKAEMMPESTGHRMALDKIEEEEMLFMHNYATQFMEIGILGFGEQEYREIGRHDQQPGAERFRALIFLDGCLKRQIQATGCQQIIAQTHFSTHRLKTMLAFYPDAKFIYIVRDPLQVVPSFLSLLHASIEFRWGIKAITPKVLQRYNERRYQAMIALYRYFHDLQTGGELPAERVMVLPYPLLRANLQLAFDRIAAFADLNPSPQLRQAIAERAGRQKEYQRKHQVQPLAAFGLSAERIREDFAFVYEAYPELAQARDNQ